MRSVLGSFALVSLLLGNLTSCQKVPTSPMVDVDSISVEELWKLVFSVNQVWLDPHPRHLSYTTTFAATKADDRIPEPTNRVWLSNDCARWEMDIRNPEENKIKKSYVLVINGNDEEYLDAPHEEMTGKPQRARDIRPLRQGITWNTSLQVLAKEGLPKESAIIERRNVPGGKVLVLETNLGKTRRAVGLGLYHLYRGRMGAPIGNVRIHIKTPEFIPIREEFLGDGFRVEYDPDFIVIGDHVAPKTIRHIGKMPLQDTEWILEGHFRNVDGNWLLEKGYNIRQGNPVFEMRVSNVSTDRIDPTQFKLTPR